MFLILISMMTKVQIFKDKNIDLGVLYERLKAIVLADKFRITRDETTENVHHLRAEKTEIKKIIIGAVRDIELIIAGEPDAFAIILSVGAWGKNLVFSGTVGYIVAAVAEGPAVAFGGLAAAGSYIRAYTYEQDFWSEILKEVEKLSKKGNTK